MLCSSISINRRAFSLRAEKLNNSNAFSIRTHVMNSYARRVLHAVEKRKK